MLKRFSHSLTIRIFLITFALLMTICAITYGAIAYLTPISYTSLLEDDLSHQSAALIEQLGRSTAEESGRILSEFARQTGAFLQLIDENGTALYDTLPIEAEAGNAVVDEIASPASDAIFEYGSMNIITSPKEDDGVAYGNPSAGSYPLVQSSSVGAAETNVQNTDDTIEESIAGSASSSLEEVVLNEGNITAVSEDKLSRYVYSLKFADGLVAQLTVQGGSRAVNQTVEALEKLLPFLILVIFAISLLGSIFYARFITKPIVSISRIAGRMASLDFKVRWRQKRGDEIGDLGNSLNLLSENLSDTLGKLEEANQKLQLDIERERELDRQRLAFFSAASHELKTPVTILKGQLSGMLAQVGIYRDREKYLARALEVTGRMEGLIKEILIISRIDSGSFTLSATEIDLSALMEEQLELDRELMEQKEMTLIAELQPSVIVRGNESLLSNALDNVLINAVQYSPRGASIRVKVTEDGFSVENSDANIPEEALAELFTPFYRVEQSRNRKSGGSGLGLYLVKSILNLHGAFCSMENTAQGVLFTARF